MASCGGRKLARQLALKQPLTSLQNTGHLATTNIPVPKHRSFSTTEVRLAKSTKPLEYHQLSPGLRGLTWEDLRPGLAEKEFPDAAPVTDCECQCLLQVPTEKELKTLR